MEGKRQEAEWIGAGGRVAASFRLASHTVFLKGQNRTGLSPECRIRRPRFPRTVAGTPGISNYRAVSEIRHLWRFGMAVERNSRLPPGLSPWAGSICPDVCGLEQAWLVWAVF